MLYLQTKKINCAPNYLHFTRRSTEDKLSNKFIV